MRARVSLVYDSVNVIPENAPRTADGMPLYPDPALYPPEIIAGFNGWIQLTRVGKIINPVWIDPSSPKFRYYPTIRKGDRRSAVVALLGEQYQVEESLDPSFYVERFSPNVAVIYDSVKLEVVCLNTRERMEEQYDIWEFVFVDPQVKN